MNWAVAQFTPLCTPLDLATYLFVARNIGTCLGIKDGAFNLSSCNITTMVTNQSKRYLFRDFLFE